MTVVVIACRVVLVALFATSAVAKLADRRNGAAAAEGLGVPPALAGPVGVVLPFAELAAVVALLFGATTRSGAALALVLLLAFTGLVVRSLRAGRRPSCHCFGQLGDAPIGAATVVRNVALMAAAVVVLAGTDGSSSALHRAIGDQLAEAGVAPALGMLALAVVAQAVAMVVLVQRQRALEARLTALEGNQPDAGLGVGTVAPAFALPDLQGDTVSLDDLLAVGKPVLVAFTDPACKPCNALLPELADWQSSFASLVTVAVLSTGDVVENQVKAAKYGLRQVLLQHGVEVAQAYRFGGTPGAVLVGEDGRIARPLATGGAAIRQMAGSVIQEARLAAAPAVVHLAVGDPAPPLQLPALDGAPVDLYDLSGRLVAMVFFSTTCSFCEALLPDLRAREADLEAADVRVLVVTTGSLASARALGLDSTMVMDDDLLTSRAFGVTGTPAALLIDAHGRVAAPAAAGAEDVLALLDRAIRLGRATEAMARRSRPPSAAGSATP